MVSFIDQHCGAYGVEPICAELPIAPSTYYEYKAREADPERVPARHRRDAEMVIDIRRIAQKNFRVYGARKVWKQLNREQIRIAKCTTERLMKKHGIQGMKASVGSVGDSYDNALAETKFVLLQA